MIIYNEAIKMVIKNALKEDIGRGDITSITFIPPARICTARIIYKQHAVVCGLPFVKWIYKAIGGKYSFRFFFRDGQIIEKNQIAATIRGNARNILAGERIVLNFLQRLSGIATYTKEFVRRTEGTNVKILDTRKTSPGLRYLEKYAVKTGGGTNHRMGLYDAILVKNNHIALAGIDAIIEKIQRLKRRYFIEVEAQNQHQAELLAKAGVDAIMLDNFSIQEIKSAIKAIRKISPKTIIEVSGGVNVNNIKKIARCYPDWISVGSLTHSAPAVDISMAVE